jgi:hypothetical protein
MAVRIQRGRSEARSHRRTLAAWAWLGLILPSASCVPAAISAPAQLASASVPVPQALTTPLPIPADGAQQSALPALGSLFNPAYAANAAIPVFSGPNPGAGSYVFRAATPLDGLRSLDCLAQAVYYEARSESENGQRAVAQVVLNRVRHPAWPDSVCGVVYQGPMRAGGGCQFTFTCDGSLAYRAAGPAWDRARQIAAEALAGHTFAPVGMSTHYHTSAVFPAWAPRLTKTAVIGAHNFYRLPGLGGAPGAFGDNYAGREPLTRPSFYMAASRQAAGGTTGDVAAFAPAAAQAHAPPAPAPVASDIPQNSRWAVSNVPESTVREEYRQSGQWREDAPTSVTGAR